MSLSFLSSLHFRCHGLNLVTKLSLMGTTKELILILTLWASCEIPQILYTELYIPNYVFTVTHKLRPT